jgi:hypothetical protein
VAGEIELNQNRSRTPDVAQTLLVCSAEIHLGVSRAGYNSPKKVEMSLWTPDVMEYR